MFKVVILLLTIFAFKQGYTLKCYDCSEVKNADCGPSLMAVFEQEECSDMGDIAVSCGTIRDFGISARACVPSNICELIDQHAEHCSVCNTDGCNNYSTNETDSNEETVNVETTTAGTDHMRNTQYIIGIGLMVLITLLNL